jgi:hypothetical protein
VGPSRFTRVYYAVAAAFLLAAATLPILVPLSFTFYGVDPGVRDMNTPESFEAYRATAAFRRGFGYGFVGLAVLFCLLSMAAVLARPRLGVTLPRIVALVAGLAAGVAAALMLIALVSGGGICC